MADICSGGNGRLPALPNKEIEAKLASARRWARGQCGPPVRYTDSLLDQLDLGRKRDVMATKAAREAEPDTVQTKLATDGGTIVRERSTHGLTSG